MKKKKRAKKRAAASLKVSPDILKTLINVYISLPSPPRMHVWRPPCTAMTQSIHGSPSPPKSMYDLKPLRKTAEGEEGSLLLNFRQSVGEEEEANLFGSRPKKVLVTR